MNEPQLHVVFGTGPLGRAVARELFAAGKSVRMVNQSGRADVPAGIDVIRGDAYSTKSTTMACANATVVYQCAAPPYHQWVERFPPLQAAVVEGAAAAGAKLVSAENLYMYGEVDGPIREDLPSAATTRKGRTRAAMANDLLEAHAKGRLRVSIGRGSDFFGPHVLSSALGERTFVPALAGKRVYAIGNIDLPHTYTFIEDFGKALVILGQRDEALGQVWHVPNAETVTTRTLVTMIFEEARQPPNVSAMSPTMMQMIGLFVPAVREMKEMMYEFQKPFVVDSSKFTRAFGNHATPIREAIGKTLVWYRGRHSPH
jgi:nucleoside-diphosphate-sugar epimerase